MLILLCPDRAEMGALTPCAVSSTKAKVQPIHWPNSSFPTISQEFVVDPSTRPISSNSEAVLQFRSFTRQIHSFNLSRSSNPLVESISDSELDSRLKSDIKQTQWHPKSLRSSLLPLRLPLSPDMLSSTPAMSTASRKVTSSVFEHHNQTLLFRMFHHRPWLATLLSTHLSAQM